MRVQIIHGVQKYNLELPQSTVATSGEEENQEKEGPEANGSQQQGGDIPWTIKRLKEEIEKLTGVPPEGQRLIRKGATLFGEDTLLDTLNFADGEKIMVLGHKPETAEDPIMRSLFTVEKTVLEGIEAKLKDVDDRLNGIQQGFLTKELVHPALNELGKQLKILGEDCMKTLELMDAMRLSEDINDKARAKRKNLVVRVQSLLRWHDDLFEQLQQIATEMDQKSVVPT